MADAFNYKPRFVDIRIKPPSKEARSDERVCEYPACRKKAEARAPKSPERLDEHYWFCVEHAAEYNRAWNFFEGKSEQTAEAFRRAAAYGHRPTWSFRHGSGSRKHADRASTDWSKAFHDPFSLFGDTPPPGAKRASPAPEKRGPGRLQEKALDTLGLEYGAPKSEVRKKYAELLRRFHPDSNGGDRSFEDRLQKVVAAYQILRGSGLA